MGLDWNKLKETLSPKFDWDAAVQAALKTEDSLEDVFVLHFWLTNVIVLQGKSQSGVRKLNREQ